MALLTLTRELINGYGIETDLYFEEGGDYYIKCISGVSTEVENYIISVLPVDNSIGEGGKRYGGIPQNV